MFQFAALAQSDFCSKLKVPGLIFCDDFESSQALTTRYFEHDANNSDFVLREGVGRQGSKGMRALWQTGEVGAGSLLKSIGRTPSTYIGRNASMPDSTFKEIYWRLDLRHQEGWQGEGPAKLTRALVMANANWATGAMAHIWSGGPGNVFLGMDPASGIDASGRLVSTRYNDFPNLRWLGFKPGNIPLFSDARVGEWFCIEAHMKLNTPGSSDGVLEFWINDSLQAGSYALNWHGNWNSDPKNYGINYISLENYWNSGSPAQQERYFDNFVIATSRIGCKETVISHTHEERNEMAIEQYGESLIWQLSDNCSGILRFYDLMGQELHQKKIFGRGSWQPEGTLPAGLYLYQFQSEDCGQSDGRFRVE
jgi:hypothetical protein